MNNTLVKSPPIRDLPDFYALMAQTPQRELHSLPSDLARRVVGLTSMEIATLRCEVPPLDELAADYSTLSRAAAFLSVWDARGRLQYMSGYALAWNLTGAMHALHPLRGIRRGLQLLADLDAATGLGVHVYTSTLRPDPRGLGLRPSPPDRPARRVDTCESKRLGSFPQHPQLHTAQYVREGPSRNDSPPGPVVSGVLCVSPAAGSPTSPASH